MYKPKIGDVVRLDPDHMIGVDQYYFETDAVIKDTRYHLNHMEYLLVWPNNGKGWAERRDFKKAPPSKALPEPDFDLDDIELAEIIMEEMEK